MWIWPCSPRMSFHRDTDVTAAVSVMPLNPNELAEVQDMLSVTGWRWVTPEFSEHKYGRKTKSTTCLEGNSRWGGRRNTRGRGRKREREGEEKGMWAVYWYRKSHWAVVNQTCVALSTHSSVTQRVECVKLAAHPLSPHPAWSGSALWKVTNVVGCSGHDWIQNSSDLENFFHNFYSLLTLMPVLFCFLDIMQAISPSFVC